MNKAEFLETLGEKLSEDLPSPLVISNLQYYESYINGAIQGGRTEQEVLEELGDPHLIARTIVDTKTGEAYYSERYAEDVEYTEAAPDDGSYSGANTYGGQSADSQSAYSSQSTDSQNTYGSQDTYGSQEAGRQQTYGRQTYTREETYTQNDGDTTPDTSSQWKGYMTKSNHGCLIVAIVLILVVIAVVSIVGSVISFLWPVIVPVLLVLLVLSIFRDRRR